MKQFIVSVLLLVSSVAGAQTREIKLATIAPAGSSWDKITQKMNEELKVKSGGKLAFKIYPGGTQGDEKDVVRKMQIGQLHAGGFTGNGLGRIAPQIRVLELPILYQSDREVDYVKEKMGPQMEAVLLKGNPPVILLGWVEAGFVYMFSKKPIRSMAEIQATKAWLWEGDPLVKSAYESLGVSPIPLAITDVMTGLSTNMIDTVYTPPLGALALQWASKVSYMSDLPLALSIGGLVMLKSEYDKIPADQQKFFREITAKYAREMVEQTRKDNLQAVEEIKRLGVQVVTVGEKEKAEFIQAIKKCWQDQSGKLYTPEQLTTIQNLVAESRSKGNSASAQLAK